MRTTIKTTLTLDLLDKIRHSRDNKGGKMATDSITYMGHHWIEISGNEITVGINDDAVSEIDSIQKLLLPEQGENFETDDVCGEIETSDGPLNLYVPVAGSISEVNPAIVEDPSLILEDPYDEGWLYKVEASNQEEVDELQNGTNVEN